MNDKVSVEELAMLLGAKDIAEHLLKKHLGAVLAENEKLKARIAELEKPKERGKTNG